MPEAKNYSGYTFDDIVFEDRNRAYGAYDLGQITKKHSVIGLICAVIGFSLLVIAGNMDWSFLKGDEEETIETTVTLVEPPPLDRNEPPPPEFDRYTVHMYQENMALVKAYNTKIEEIKGDIAVETKKGDDNAPTIIKEAEPEPEPAPVEEKIVKEPEVFNFVQQMPEFPGGNGALQKFMAENTKYPTIDKENGVEGTVAIRFVVLEDVVRSVSPTIDKEALRLVKMLPKFNPGKQNGKSVRVNFNLPVKFKLQ